MKRILAFLLCCCLLVAFPGCSSSKMQDPGNFYYRQKPNDHDNLESVITPEVRDLIAIRDDMDALFEVYFSGPTGSDLESPFPRETYVVSWTLENGTLCLTMNEGFSALSGIDLTIACSCITRTFLELTSARRVTIRAEHSTLNGADAITMSESNLILVDDVLDRLYPTLTLYYTDEAHRYLIGHEISVDLADESEIISHLINQLADAPEGGSLVSTLPQGTKLLDVTIDDGTCILNLSEEFQSNCFSATEGQRLTLLSIVNTLVQLDNISQVEICVEGRLLAQYGDLTISGALVPDSSAIGPLRTAMNEMDATLYLSNGSAGYLAAVPTRIQQNPSVIQAELVLQALLDFKSINGFENTIPTGTRLHSLTVVNGVCIVDLSEEFLSSTEHIPTSVRSIAASLCALDSVHSIRITVDGSTPDGEYSSWFTTLSPQADWFL